MAVQNVKNLSLKKRKFSNQKQLLLMSIPLILYIILFTYVPLWGWTMAFQDYKLNKAFSDQTWVGFQWFVQLFSDEVFPQVLRNTIAMSVINIILGFTTAIVLALMLNEVKKIFFKRVIQTISYLPHFLSWVIVAGLVQTTLSSSGIFNDILMRMGIISEPVMWLAIPEDFWGIIGITNVWKEIGWNTIIYLAAMSAIDPALYEAAEMDGCNRFSKMWNITLPGLKPTIIVLLIMSIGRVLDAGFELQYILTNGLVVDYSQTIDVFVVRYGYENMNYSLATAAGMFKTVVSIFLVFGANFLAKRLGEERLI